MSDPGLSHRLRQRSRRAGLMIGLSMVLTIALCAVAFTMIYAALDGFTNDFISETDETTTVEAQVAQEQESNPQETPDTGGDTDQSAGNQNEEQQAPQPTEPPEPEPTPTAEEEADNADDGEFTPDYQIDAGATVNLRAGPSTATDILNGLPPATPLEYLGEDAPTDSSEDGERWMKFATEDGLEGWVREIDIIEYQP